MKGEEDRGILGKGARYNPLRLCQKPSVIRYFDGFIKKCVTSDDRVLDFGCGPGTFAIRMARYCKSIVGVDITQEFINEATRSFEVLGLTNAIALHVAPSQLPFSTASFDVVLMVDVIHHLDNIPASFQEVLRVLKPGGKILIFEPNKLNPLIWLVHYFDKNERGLLALGTPWKYVDLLKQYASNIEFEYNGIVIGPRSKVFDFIAALINHRALYPFLGWLNPKIALYAKENGGRQNVCDACGSKNIRIIKNTDVFSQEVFDVIWCTVCEFGKTDFKSTMPLSSYYPPTYYGRQDRRFVGIVEFLVRLRRVQRAKTVQKWCSNQTKRILDFGCGRGLMLAYLRNHGWSCIGTEFSEESSQYARNLGLDIVIPVGGKDSTELLQGAFGVVTALHVLEHLNQPFLVLQRFHRLLESGGLLVLEVPNFSSFQARLSREHWIYTECPRHLQHFSPKSLVWLLVRSGFEVKAINTFSWEYGVFGLLQSLLNIVCPQKNVLFYLFRNASGKPHRFDASVPAVFSLFATLVLLLPFFLISMFMEGALSLFGKGGVITVVGRKRSD